MSTAPILEILDATVVKDDRPLLDRLSPTIRAGEHTAILGPNGAGKSLLIGPSVVSAVKSGAVSPSCSAIWNSPGSVGFAGPAEAGRHRDHVATVRPARP